MNNKFYLLFLFTFLVNVAFAQEPEDGFNPNPSDAGGNEDLIEDFIQNNELGEEFDYNTFVEQLAYFQEKPINLNSTTAEQLKELGLLTDLQVENLLSYIQNYGDLIVIYELQAVPGFDIFTIKRILPYVKVGGDLNDYQVSIPNLILKGKNELFLRARRNIENSKGYLEEDPTKNRYLGDPYQFYTRFRHTYENKISYGFSAEKDPGEEFFKGSNKQGFDFYSAHFFLKDYRKWLKAVAIGDYTINMGQGLIHFAGFGGGKGAFVTNIKRGGRTIQPFTSINESAFFRGVGLSVQPFKNIEVTSFASYRKRDGNITVLTDTTDLIGETLIFTSFGTSGLHRTNLEIADESALSQTSFGGVVKYRRKQLTIGLNALFENLSKPFQRSVSPYNQFQYSGTSILNTSIDYSYIHKNLNFFGETALNINNQSVATINGLIIGVDRKVDIAILYRNLPKDYVSLTPNIFAETSQGNNEVGTYFGIEIKPNRSWKWSNYVDLWKHPWLRFNLDSPSDGFEYLSRLTFIVKRKLEIYTQYRYERKGYNQSSNETVFNQIVDLQRNNLRFQVNNKISKTLELRNRLEFSFYKNGENPTESGFMLYQDIIYKPVGLPVSFTGRLAIFETEDYNTRIYAYENDLLNSFSVPPYYQKGVRAYLNLRYKGIRDMTAEFRVAQTWYQNQDTFGSGLDLINDNKRTEVKAQIRYAF